MRQSTKSRDGDIEELQGLGRRRTECEKRTCERQRKGMRKDDEEKEREKERERGRERES